MNRSKSQIAMLMIVGLALFVIVSLVLYISKSAVKKQSQQSVKKTQETKAETQPVKEMVASCLDKTAKDAIVLLGKQGGYIYKSQGGTLVDYGETDEGILYVKHDGVNVAYNILPPRFSAFPYSSETPEYPWKTFPYRTESSKEEIFEGYFGISNLLPLNSSEGPNSMQEQLESFIDSNIDSCLDFRLFEQQGIQITKQTHKTSATIGSNDITVNSKIPIKIINPATNEIAEFSGFSTNINIRLRDIYFFAREIAENDIKNIKFNISDKINERDNFKIGLIKDVFSNDDLITISDEKSQIYGKPFEYIFARRNRAPALHYIKKTALEFPEGHQITQQDLLQNSTLKAYDADEDEFSFTITPPLPKVLNVPQIQFKVEVSDGKLNDYQTLTIKRI